MTLCPCCGQPLPIDPVEAQADAIRTWCRDNGVPILLGDCVRRSDAATFLGRSEKTLSNWAAVDSPIPVRRLNGRAYYEIRDLAVFVASR
ncbi:hypothetical protein [Azotobacter armeniacus]